MEWSKKVFSCLEKKRNPNFNTKLNFIVFKTTQY